MDDGLHVQFDHREQLEIQGTLPDLVLTIFGVTLEHVVGESLDDTKRRLIRGLEASILNRPAGPVSHRTGRAV